MIEEVDKNQRRITICEIQQKLKQKTGEEWSQQAIGKLLKRRIGYSYRRFYPLYFSANTK